MKYLISTFLLFSFHSNAFSAQVNDFTATYALYHNDIYVGQSIRRLSTNNKLQTFTSTAKTEGIASWFFNITITETSKLRFENNQLNFVSYHYNEKNNDKNKSHHIRLENPGKFYNSYTKKHYPVTDNLHDTLGFTVAIMSELQAGKREIKYTIAEKKKVRKYTLKLIKQEALPTKTGTINTLKMEHFDAKTNRRFTLWCAKDFNFLPIKIQKINHKGDENLLTLTHLNQKPVHLSLNDESID